MFKIQEKKNLHNIVTAYAADYGYGKFLIASSWGDFEWVPIDDYWLYEEEEPNAI